MTTLTDQQLLGWCLFSGLIVGGVIATLNIVLPSRRR